MDPIWGPIPDYFIRIFRRIKLPNVQRVKKKIIFDLLKYSVR